MDDYISREAAIKAAKCHYPKANEMIAGIILVPASDVRPVVRGHWIEHISDLFPADSTIECDQCHAEQPTGIDDNFCPNCGADMRETNLDITKAKGGNHD